MIPDLDGFLAGLAAWVRKAQHPVETYAFGSHSEQVADLRLPVSGGAHSVAVLLHGGFWRSRFTRASMEALAVDLARRGYATWNVEYRRVGCGGGIPETLDDVHAALQRLNTIETPIIERARCVLVGHSAGGQLALWAAGTGAVSAVVSLGGVCDLTAAARAGLGDGAAVEFAGGTPEERPEAYDRADPLRRLPVGIPVLLVHGDADDRVPIEHSRRYARLAQAFDDPCELVELGGVGHFELIDPRTEAWAESARLLDALVVPHAKRGAAA